MTLLERCKAFLDQRYCDGILRGEPELFIEPDDLMAFVVAETGRSADKSLKESLPLCLYFVSEQDRDEFIALVHEAKPNMRVKQLP